MSEKIYVLDSTAFYAGLPFQGEARYYTTYQVLDEVRNRNVASPLVHSRVQVLEPSRESIQKVRAKAVRTGDSRSLSEADTSIIAVSLDISHEQKGEDVVLVSDDFAVRNVAEVLGVNLSSTTIRGEWKSIVWITYCKGCGKEYSDPKLMACNVCGTKLSRKPGTPVKT